MVTPEGISWKKKLTYITHMLTRKYWQSLFCPNVPIDDSTTHQTTFTHSSLVRVRALSHWPCADPALLLHYTPPLLRSCPRMWHAARALSSTCQITPPPQDDGHSDGTRRDKSSGGQEMWETSQLRQLVWSISQVNILHVSDLGFSWHDGRDRTRTREPAGMISGSIRHISLSHFLMAESKLPTERISRADGCRGESCCKTTRRRQQSYSAGVIKMCINSIKLHRINTQQLAGF